MSNAYLASSIPPHELAELHRLMNEEVEDVAVFFMNPDGIITVWNRGAEEMKGFTAQDAIGSHLALLYTDEDRARNWPQHNLDEARKNGFYREETWRRRKDGSLFWARIALTALRDESGQLLGFSKITFDLTDHKLLERCVKEREHTRRILRAANAGTWTWHPERERINVCENFLALLGRPGTDTTLTLDEWMEFIHPDDRPLVARKFEAARANGPGVPFAAEMRLCPIDSMPRWFYVQADWYREKPGDPYELNGVNVDIQQLKTAEAELRQAIDKLREADKRKDEFLAMLAHELRNPLAPIRAAAEVLRMVKLDDAQVQETSAVIARQVTHMTSLVDDLLDVSRVTRGLVKLDKAPLDVRQIVTEAVEQVNPIVRARRHHLALHLSPLATVVLGDRKRLVQIIANLLNNAAKFTHEGGHIVLKTEVRDGKVMLSVTDDGIGMEPALAARVFELFAQAERTPDRSSGGLGLGLALVKSLVELQGGTVSCSSEGLGKGSNFTVSLPLVHVPGNRLEPRNPGENAQPPKRPLRVMVVDDNVDAAAMMAMLLNASGHQVTVEHRGPQALARARTERPDVYLLDIGLPEMDGNELAQRLRGQPETDEAVLIAVTGYGQEQDREAALAAGFNHHLVKPVDAAELRALLAEIAARRP
jgi:PAS domain S-box-containing protein